MASTSANWANKVKDQELSTLVRNKTRCITSHNLNESFCGVCLFGQVKGLDVGGAGDGAASPTLSATTTEGDEQPDIGTK